MLLYEVQHLVIADPLWNTGKRAVDENFAALAPQMTALAGLHERKSHVLVAL